MADIADEVAMAWEVVHQKLGDPSARVPREAFVQFCMENLAPADGDLNSYEAYLNILFDSATGLMLPAQKTDLGKHCFGYATILAREFYFGQPADMLSLKADQKPMDRLSAVRQDFDMDWEAVAKDGEGRVPLDAFVNYFMSKHADKLSASSQAVYQEFLERNFTSSLAMMLPQQKTNLGGHCFRYASLLAGEFYFDAANEATAGCGCSAPVADVLQIAQSRPQPAQPAQLAQLAVQFAGASGDIPVIGEAKVLGGGIAEWDGNPTPQPVVRAAIGGTVVRPAAYATPVSYASRGIPAVAQAPAYTMAAPYGGGAVLRSAPLSSPFVSTQAPIATASFGVSALPVTGAMRVAAAPRYL